MRSRLLVAAPGGRGRGSSRTPTGATAEPGSVGAGGGWRRLVLVLRDQEALRHLGITDVAEYALRDVLADHRRELEPLGVAAAGDPGVRHLRVDVDDEVAARRLLVMARARLVERRILEDREPHREEATRSLDPARVRPT